MPVLPEVGSMIVPPGLRRPLLTASSTMATAMRSFTLPVGLCDSILAMTCPGKPAASRRMRTSGVLPSVEVMSSWIITSLDREVRHEDPHLARGNIDDLVDLELQVREALARQLGVDQLLRARRLELDLDA